VKYTCDESSVIDERGNATNRNAAQQLGLTVAPATLSNDTLHVTMDVSGALREGIQGYSVDSIVKATYECLLLNARKSREGYSYEHGERVTANFVRVTLTGSDAYRSIGKTYSFEKDLSDLPRQRVFY